MAGINVCATLGGNTGKPACDVRMGRIKYAWLTTSKEFTEEELSDSDSLEAAIQTAMGLANSNPNKMFLFPEMRVSTDNTGDPNTGTLADGYEEVLNEALPKYLLQSTPGVCVQQQMASFNGWPGKIYVVDENGIFWYKTKADGGGKGFTCGYLYTNPPKFKGSADVQTANTRLTFGSIDEFKRGVGALKLDFVASDLINLKDVELTDEEDTNDSGALNNVFLIGANVKCEGTNLYDTYADLLNNAAMWRIYEADGTVIPVTAVAKNDTLKAWQITANSSAFNALEDNAVFYIDLQVPATLTAAGVEGIEAQRIRFVKFL